ncbi:hypothetical protein BKA62DRAFT_816100 [Auriculariales sp. MPI-PUGE-AT-0066]|nr:hypothetical protein BKA62DRAFT_816100 [Auriculariales sp. MPI-PUGE-AT-0066]
MSSRFNFDVAVVGGGIAGVTLTIGLLRAGVPVGYEAAHAFGEIGAGLAFGPNAARAMSMLSPEVVAGFERVSTSNQCDSKKSVWFDFRRGMGPASNPQAGQGELIHTLHMPPGGGSVHRAHFLDELVKLLPNGIAHLGKLRRSTSAVVGSDGIKSRTRRIVLGEDNPAARARFSGKYAYRGLIPMQQAVDLLGDELARNSQMYFGHHGHVLTFPIEHGTTMNVVAFASKPEWQDNRWVVPSTKEELQHDFDGWSQHVKSILSLVQRTDIWALFEHPPAARYTRDHICLIGDAAHATTPHQGAGAGMAVEDAWLLSTLVGELASTSDDLQAVFNAFERVRIDRTQRLVRTSNEAGRLYDFELDGVADDSAKIKECLKTRMQWIWEEDLEHELATAKEVFLAERDGLRTYSASFV